jgi:lactobin A/cerein 7B family class IIb bacteriocin
MDSNNLTLRKLNKSELKEIEGGFLGTAIAIASLAVAAYGTAMAAAYYEGYDDAKDECPQPCT